jgi:hypothetical protein
LEVVGYSQLLQFTKGFQPPNISHAAASAHQKANAAADAFVVVYWEGFQVLMHQQTIWFASSATRIVLFWFKALEHPVWVKYERSLGVTVL